MNNDHPFVFVWCCMINLRSRELGWNKNSPNSHTGDGMSLKNKCKQISRHKHMFKKTWNEKTDRTILVGNRHNHLKVLHIP